MSRFGTTGTFAYDPGDTFSGGTGIALEAQDMPQFPFDTEVITDSEVYRTKSGQRYEYENWQKERFTFNWVDLRESKRDELYSMVQSLPILTFASPPSTLWGTYRAIRSSWEDTETSHERYDVSFTIEQE